MNLIGEPAHVGRHCGSSQYTIEKSTVRFYQDALDDHHSLHDRFAPPLLHHSECYKFLGQWYLKNLFGNLHGQQDWECFSPIPVGSKVRTRSTIIDRYTRRGRDWIVNETDLMSAEAEDEGKTYHTDREEAKKLGFPNIVVQGMMSTCFVSQVMQDHFGLGWLQGGRMSVKLTNVLWVDETVSAHARVREETREGTRTRIHCDVWVEKTDGVRVILGTASALREEA